MSIHSLVKRNTYLDSVTLMRVSTQVNELEGVTLALVGMGTPMNKAVLKESGLLTPDLEKARTSDLMISVKLTEGVLAEDIFTQVEALLQSKPSTSASENTTVYHSIEAATQAQPDSNLVLISVNGAFAPREAQKALLANKHVMLFSDNVSCEDEVRLKTLAHERGLLLMGPDCGTAIINGVGLGFANQVRRGPIGVVAASGTGAQEVSVRVHEFGSGISQLIGTGGRDLKLGARMMLDGLAMLADDPETKVIMLVSKPPAPEVAQQVLKAASEVNKPVFVQFLGWSGEEQPYDNVRVFAHSKPAAMAAVIAAGIDEDSIDKHALNWPLIEQVRAQLKPTQRYVRGLFCGGTLCDEALFAAAQKYDDVYSNIHPDESRRLGPNDPSRGHTFLDFGDDAFTNGRAHPMIDPTYRIARIYEEGKDPTVGCLLLDFVLGFGAHEDPVGATLEALKAVKAQAAEQGRTLPILAYVLGTDLDQPSVQAQVAKLEAAGIIIASSSTNAGLLAREFVFKGEN